MGLATAHLQKVPEAELLPVGKEVDGGGFVTVAPFGLKEASRQVDAGENPLYQLQVLAECRVEYAVEIGSGEKGKIVCSHVSLLRRFIWLGLIGC
jgi:hypothetical protein